MASKKSAGIDYGLGIDSGDMGDGIKDYGLMLQDYDNSKELRIRGGIPNVLNKLTCGRRVTVGYIGGSITRQEGWRPRTTSWLKSRFPNATIVEVNAAISGTGANLGAARIEHDLLIRNPDLIFVEFVINGAGLKDIEGMVRKIWSNNPNTDICFVYTLNSAQVESYIPDADPSFPSSLTAFETIAEYYGIPGIFFGYILGELYALDKLVPKGDELIELIDADGRALFTKDGIHPVGTGDQLYAGTVARSILKMQKEGIQPAAHVLKAPMDPNNWEDAIMRDAADFTSSLDVVDTKTAEFDTTFPYTGHLATIKEMYPRLVKMTTPGDRITVTFKGTILGIADVGGHQYFFLPEMEDEQHTVSITLMSEISDKRNIVQNKADYDRNPDAYKGNEVYIGKIITVGRFVESC